MRGPRHVLPMSVHVLLKAPNRKNQKSGMNTGDFPTTARDSAFPLWSRGSWHLPDALSHGIHQAVHLQLGYNDQALHVRRSQTTPVLKPFESPWIAVTQS